MTPGKGFPCRPRDFAWEFCGSFAGFTRLDYVNEKFNGITFRIPS